MIHCPIQFLVCLCGFLNYVVYMKGKTSCLPHCRVAWWVTAIDVTFCLTNGINAQRPAFHHFLKPEKEIVS